MPKKPNLSEDPAGLRRRAEARLNERQSDPSSEAGTQRVFHELEVHQIELELQNAELHRTRNELEAALESFADLYDFAPVGYLSVDESGVIREANLTAADLLGVQRSRLINRRLPLFVSATSQPGFLAFLNGVFTEVTGQSCEALLRKEGGGTFWADFRAALAASPKGTRRWCRLTFEDVTPRKQAEERQLRLGVLSDSNRELKMEIARRRTVEKSLRKSEKEKSRLLMQSRSLEGQLRHITRRTLHAQEEERKRISRELHDGIAQALVGIHVQLAALTRGPAGDARRFDQKVARTQELVKASVELVHRFARDLRPPALDDLGLLPALRGFLKEYAKRSRLSVRLTASGTVEQLDVATRTALYRVAQEALNNVARHAKASQVEVSLRKLSHSVRMRITDDGKSFKVERALQPRDRKHLGILGMKERLEMAGGRLTIESAPGKGTVVTAEVPSGNSRGTGKSAR